MRVSNTRSHDQKEAQSRDGSHDRRHGQGTVVTVKGHESQAVPHPVKGWESRPEPRLRDGSHGGHTGRETCRSLPVRVSNTRRIVPLRVSNTCRIVSTERGTFKGRESQSRDGSRGQGTRVTGKTCRSFPVRVSNTRRIVPFSDAVASRVPSSVSARHLCTFVFTLVTGPRSSLRLKLSDTRVYEP